MPRFVISNQLFLLYIFISYNLVMGFIETFCTQFVTQSVSVW